MPAGPVSRIHQFEGLASPYLSQFINNLKEFQEMNRKARELEEVRARRAPPAAAAADPLADRRPHAIGAVSVRRRQQNDEMLALDQIAPEVPGPEGRIALVIVDMEHWSKLWDDLAQDMNDVLRVYNRQLRMNMRKCRGTLCAAVHRRRGRGEHLIHGRGRPCARWAGRRAQALR